ncbi:FCD domain-containing protein [Cohaesibacter gelatinilyticus]|uniref:Transcriptional regulator, GntR family n=1 Tax=Cohaesibacter gelatinilyticus TaxID=372072 RepID=A0A285PCA8_9HYPH|nr:FCD domain-containing protein [Cohaesibacter gelatinilyticus]SNZ19362.1 transcriptional regulator, GntR family [Cohaesibacter gelatinilyticus]
MAKEDENIPDARRMADQIAETLIDQIKHGKMEVGALLPTERELCETFDASRPTIRSALNQMRQLGFLSAESGKRPRITKPSLEGILQSTGDHIRGLLGDAETGAHLEQIRQFLEAGAAREAAKRASNVQIANLARELHANFEAIGTSDFPATDIAFHRSLLSVLGNPIVLQLHDMFVSRMVAERPGVKDQIAHDQTGYQEHRAIYQAVLEGDSVAASDMMDQHLIRSYRSRLKSPASIEIGDQEIGQLED